MLDPESLSIDIMFWSVPHPQTQVQLKSNTFFPEPHIREDTPETQDYSEMTSRESSSSAGLGQRNVINTQVESSGSSGQQSKNLSRIQSSLRSSTTNKQKHDVVDLIVDEQPPKMKHRHKLMVKDKDLMTERIEHTIITMLEELQHEVQEL
ncbi:hypothetical protein BDQ17DRAFT_1424820 [Cyathus striatus]|nr:hypothetical protein BDQ17DRAFT_1424820 [Cyathus striatus]